MFFVLEALPPYLGDLSNDQLVQKTAKYPLHVLQREQWSASFLGNDKTKKEC